MIKFNWEETIVFTCKDGSEHHVDPERWSNEILSYEFIIYQGQCFVLMEDNRAIYVQDIGEIFSMLSHVRTEENDKPTHPELMKGFLYEAQAYIQHAIDVLE